MSKKAERRLFMITCNYDKKAKTVSESFGVTEEDLTNFIGDVQHVALKTDQRITTALITVLERNKEAGGILLSLACMKIAEFIGGDE